MINIVNLLTVKQLRYLIALEKHAHFGKAAEACFVSQSAFSVAIRKLESTLGTQLFDRTNKRVVFPLSATSKPETTLSILIKRDGGMCSG